MLYRIAGRTATQVTRSIAQRGAVHHEALIQRVPKAKLRHVPNMPTAAEISKLRELEKGPWTSLSMDDKVKLYKATYGLSRVQLQLAHKAKDTGKVVAGTAGIVAVSLFLAYLSRVFSANPDGSRPMTDERIAAVKERMVKENMEPIGTNTWSSK
eukprot:Clim_evm1s24 gene=Clim_evmTU1s24